MKNKSLYFLFLLLCVGAFFDAHGRFIPEKIFLNNISLKNGLSQVVVTDMVQGNKGFIWFATFDGLNRFDGHNIKTFRHNPEDSTSIPSSKIHRLATDMSGYLYLITNNGFVIFDNTSNQTIRPNFLKKYKPNWVCIEDTFHTWMFINNKGLILVDTRDMSVQEKFDKSFKANTCDVLNMTKMNSTIFIETACGDIIEYNSTNGKYIYHEIPFKKSVYNSVGVDKFNTIFMGSPETDLVTFNVQTKQFNRSNLCVLNPKLVSVNNILYDSIRDVLLLATYGQGLFVYDYETKQLTQRMKAESSLPLASNYLLSLLQDKNGILYIGYDGSGFDVLDPYVKKFVPIIKNDPNDIQTIKFVRKLAEDDNGNLLIGTAGSGLVKYNMYSKEFKFINTNIKEIVSDNYIIEMLRVNNELWLGFNGNGIGILDLNTFKPLGYIKQGIGNTNLSNGIIWSMLNDQNGNIWLGTRENGINKVDIQTRDVKQFTANKYPFFKENGLRCLFKLNDNTILIGTENGICSINSQNDKLTILFPNQSANTNTALKSIKCFHLDKKGRIWAGTDGGGILVFNQNFDIIRTFSTNDFLNNNVVYSILEETPNSFWISSNSGISNIIWDEDVLLKKRKPQIRNFDEVNGLQSNEFNTGAYLRLKNGDLAFGGLNGINIFNPKDIKNNPALPLVYISEFKVFENNLKSDIDVSFLKEVKLNHYENSISLSFNILGLNLFGKTKYQYRLLGYDKDWINTTDRNYVSYTNLDYGNYEFQVKATNYDGIWNNDYTSLKIVIATPFYKSWWFLTLMAALIASIVYSIYKNKENQRKEKEKIRFQYNKELAEVEMKALRAQINPHFLFNSLNSINNFILKNDTKQASKYLVKFSQLVRNILNNSSSTYINLSEELSTIELYILIEGMRFSNQFSYYIEVDEDIHTSNIRIPSLLLQPYVENAIWHGLLHKDGEKLISIKVSKLNSDYISISIEDNGVGRETAREIEQKPKDRKSFGMQLGENRLRLMSSSSDFSASVEVIDLTLPDGTPSGTKILLTIPIHISKEAALQLN